ATPAPPARSARDSWAPDSAAPSWRWSSARAATRCWRRSTTASTGRSVRARTRASLQRRRPERASRASTAREACARQAPSERCVSPVETARLEIVYTLVVSGVRIPPSPLRWRPGDDEGARSDVAAAVRSERCPSGRRGTPGERVYLHRYRGFESLPLRSACAFLAPPLPP